MQGRDRNLIASTGRPRHGRRARPRQLGGLDRLRLGGVAVGSHAHGPERAAAERSRAEAGSCIGVVATDIPLDARQLTRVARRVGLGLARLGSIGGHGSGEIFCAFSTTNRRSGMAEGVAPVDVLGDGSINAVFAATVDATEEAVTNALFVADTVVGRDGQRRPRPPRRPRPRARPPPLTRVFPAGRVFPDRRRDRWHSGALPTLGWG